jgi:hypothetical protein
MVTLRKVSFSSDYWHVINDEPGDKEGIVGSLLYTPGHTLLPWRAEFAPIWGRPEDLRVAHCRTEEEALEFLREQLERGGR